MFFMMPFTPGIGANVAYAKDWTFWGTWTSADGECGVTSWPKFQNCLVNTVKLFVYDFPKYLFSIVAIVFDVLVAFSLSSGPIQNVNFVDEGWVIMRDLSNTFFIFILLYIAISTILQTAGGQTKRLLATLVMVALLMNFSLYITKFVIDVGNVFALEFYVNITTPANTPNYVTIQGAGAVNPIRGIAEVFLNAFNLEKIPLAQTNGNFVGKMFLYSLIGIFYLVAIFVFLSAAFLFLARVVAFWFLMILAPLAFFSMILPYTRSKIWGPWSSQLVSQSFFAPIFLFFVYLTIMLADIVAKGDLFQLGTATVAGDMSFIPQLIFTFLNFFALIMTLLFGLKTAKSMSGGIGESMTKIGGGVVLGGTGVAMRQTVGRLATHISDKYGDRMKTSTLGQYALKGTDKLASGSFDARASRVGSMMGSQTGLGQAGGAGGYAKVAQDKEAANKKMGDSLKNNPEAHAKFIASLQKTGGDIRVNPDRDAMQYWGTLSTRERQEAKAAATGANKTYLESLDSKLTGGFKEKQLKAEEKGKRAFSAENAKDTIEELEGMKTPAERELYINQLINGNPLKNIPGLDKEHRLALYKNMTAAQRAEAKGLNDKIFKDISDSDLTREEISRITGQDRKYKIEDMAKAAQKERAANIEKLVRDTTRTDTEQQKAEIKDIVDKMRGNELAELEESLLTNDLIIPHIKPKHIQKIEKEGYNISQGSMETLYKKIKQTNPETQAYIENREFGEPARGARRRFQGGRDNRAGNSN